MLKLIDAKGVTREVEGIDVNVCNYTGDVVEITGYEQHRNDEGLWVTDTGITIFHGKTTFGLDDYDDEWYGYAEDDIDSEMPSEVLELVARVLSEIKVPA